MIKKINIVVLILFVASTLACSFSTAKIKEAKLARSVDDSKRAVNPTSTFDSSDKIIHCVVDLANAPNDTVVKAQWVAVNVKGVASDKDLVDTEISAGGSKNIVDFTLTSENGFSPGDYKVDLYLNPKSGTKPVKTMSFKVKASESTSSSSIKIAKAILSTDENGESQTTIFPTDASMLYCHILLSGPAPGTTMTGSWVAVKTELNDSDHEIDRASVTLGSSHQPIYFSLKPRTKLPVGDYRIDLYVNNSDSPTRSIAFRVED